MTAVPTLTCPYPSCRETFLTTVALALHLVEIHNRPHGESFLEAQGAYGGDLRLGVKGSVV
ncbi:MAG: hypothetical protein ABW020_01040 [Candidatus Rokuibacteriota bacterium]